ncbi:MAG: tetratricopeptide repeat protein, partial [Burkholderiaceae bacterium]
LALRKKHENALSTTLLASETLQRAGRHRDAEALLEETLQIYRSDPEVYERLAESEGALGKTAEQHLHLSHSYELQGAFQAAIEQAQIARRAVRNDFYLQSQLDVRLKALQAKAAEEKAELRQ